MSLLLDHVFLLTEPGAPAAELLASHGLEEGEPNDHPGQGSANRRFWFDNLMLELLWVRDAAEARAGADGLQLPERRHDPAASPCGLIFRDTQAGAPMPFSGWRYHPAYFADSGYWFHVGDNARALCEPLCVFMPFASGPPGVTESSAGAVSEVRVTVAAPVFSAVLRDCAAVPLLRLETGSEALLELTLTQPGEPLDLRPALPLVLRR